MDLPVVAVIGPTSSGKSKLAVSLAEKFDGEIVSGDSRQVYRGLNLGTGKITKPEMAGIPHHMLDITSPLEQFTVAQYVPLAEEAIGGIIVRSKLPIVCGGSGHYIDSLLRGEAIPEVPPQEDIRAELEPKSTQELMLELEKIDPVRASTIDPDNKRRIIRAIEIVRFTGKPVPVIEKGVRRPFDVLWLGIDVGADDLRKRIGERLDERIDRGLVVEVEGLHKLGLSWERMEELGLEYRYTARLLQGQISREEYRRQLFEAICQYARRQRTWWRQHTDITWIKGLDEAIPLVEKFIQQPH